MTLLHGMYLTQHVPSYSSGLRAYLTHKPGRVTSPFVDHYLSLLITRSLTLLTPHPVNHVEEHLRSSSSVSQPSLLEHVKARLQTTSAERPAKGQDLLLSRPHDLLPSARDTSIGSSACRRFGSGRHARIFSCMQPAHVLQSASAVGMPRGS